MHLKNRWWCWMSCQGVQITKILFTIFCHCGFLEELAFWYTWTQILKNYHKVLISWEYSCLHGSVNIVLMPHIVEYDSAALLCSNWFVQLPPPMLTQAISQAETHLIFFFISIKFITVQKQNLLYDLCSLVDITTVETIVPAVLLLQITYLHSLWNQIGGITHKFGLLKFWIVI